MSLYLTTSSAIEGYYKAMRGAMVKALRSLLEEKHIYQSVTIDEELARTEYSKLVSPSILRDVEQRGGLHISPSVCPWQLKPDHSTIIQLRTHHYELTPTRAKLFCKVCDRIEAFNYVSGWSAIAETEFVASENRCEQVFALSYLCQSCHKLPEVFLVRRSKGKLTLGGRSPMEQVAVPAEIPKDVKEYYSGAVVAYQSGQTLAGLFMLRTLC
jgi:hypothetical protein